MCAYDIFAGIPNGSDIPEEPSRRNDSARSRRRDRYGTPVSL